MFIRSERLFLRPGWPEDWEELLDLIDDETVVRNIARAPWPYRGEHARAFLELPQEPLFPRFLVTLPGAGGAQVVGGVGLNPSERGPELGYWIGRRHWGRGYASESARAVLSIARVLGHGRVVAHHFVDNPASGRVLEKAGFCRTGRVSERYSVGRGASCPAREYESVLERPCGCDDDDDAMRRQRAA